ncbi:hypothetical protein G5B46_21175 [Caulobacter sp. 602-2]|uniref:Uncharacterized protein n=1 Tax=Caulobacter sp. 602-2 TaxID=2710887 RepID=A0A6G4R2M5_9CAUL|nr:hypothetical protein [Caulobacter sp. 602-2]NGM52130.1 hypothetical protein [Caulobacter sp. 602-2]
MSRRYYRCDWKSLDEANPTAIFYEVDAQDLVTRTINVFADDEAVGHEASEFPAETRMGQSLVDGTFSRATEGMAVGETDQTGDGDITLHEIDEREFETAWELTLTSN